MSVSKNIGSECIGAAICRELSRQNTRAGLSLEDWLALKELSSPNEVESFLRSHGFGDVRVKGGVHRIVYRMMTGRNGKWKEIIEFLLDGLIWLPLWIALCW